MKEKIDEIVNEVSKRPTDILALGRTVMASERTFLGYVRTSVSFLAGGIGIVMYLHNPFLIAFGVVLILSSIFIFVVGVKNYRRIQRLLLRVFEALRSSHELHEGHTSTDSDST